MSLFCCYEKVFVNDWEKLCETLLPEKEESL